jgi:PGAP1-like protein
VSDRMTVDYASLGARADGLERMSTQIVMLLPGLAAAAARFGLHELVGYGILGGVPVAADLVALCTPGIPGSLPDVAAELLALAAAVRAAGWTYLAVDGVRWARSEIPTAEALIMLQVWNGVHLAVNLTAVGSGNPCAPGLSATLIDQPGEALLERMDRWIEGNGRVSPVAPGDLPSLSAAPATGLDSLLGVVNTISDARHPSTAALLHVGDDPPRYVLCLPGLQNDAGPDNSAADLPGVITTLAGHSSYIRGMRAVLEGLPPGSRVLLVGHSQGGMVAEALATGDQVGDATIAGVLTAGSPLIATSVSPRVPYLALQNDGDPVPKLRGLAGGVINGGRLQCAPSGRSLVTFSTPGLGPSPSKHGLGSGGYLRMAGSDNRRVQAFRQRVGAFFTAGPVQVTYLQVTDSDGALPR